VLERLIRITKEDKEVMIGMIDSNRARAIAVLVQYDVIRVLLFLDK